MASLARQVYGLSREKAWMPLPHESLISSNISQTSLFQQPRREQANRMGSVHAQEQKRADVPQGPAQIGLSP